MKERERERNYSSIYKFESRVSDGCYGNEAGGEGEDNLNINVNINIGKVTIIIRKFLYMD